jgi:uncharacterized DUF497 family protein
VYFDWSEEKNDWLKLNRKVCFEDVVQAIEAGKLISIIDHQNKDKYPNQKLFVIGLNGYVHYVPFVKDEVKYWLKTIVPSRKLHKIYKGAK